MKLKEWKYNDMVNKMLKYGELVLMIEVERNDNTIKDVKVTDGYVNILTSHKVLKETEKAVYVEFGIYWKEWIPKSAIA